LQKLFITQAKKTVERVWLSEVSNIPLQQSLNDLEQAYQNFFKSSCKKERKGKPVRPPKFKKRRAAQSARFRKGGFKVGALGEVSSPKAPTSRFVKHRSTLPKLDK
jgi:putative transposase